MTPIEAAITVLAGFGAIVAGVALLGGLAWALIVSGVAVVVAAVLLYDPKSKRRWRRRQTSDQLAAARTAARAVKNWNG